MGFLRWINIPFLGSRYSPLARSALLLNSESTVYCITRSFEVGVLEVALVQKEATYRAVEKSYGESIKQNCHEIF
jgi:hypothetical protein